MAALHAPDATIPSPPRGTILVSSALREPGRYFWAGAGPVCISGGGRGVLWPKKFSAASISVSEIVWFGWIVSLRSLARAAIRRPGRPRRSVCRRLGRRCPTPRMRSGAGSWSASSDRRPFRGSPRVPPSGCPASARSAILEFLDVAAAAVSGPRPGGQVTHPRSSMATPTGPGSRRPPRLPVAPTGLPSISVRDQHRASDWAFPNHDHGESHHESNRKPTDNNRRRQTPRAVDDDHCYWSPREKR